jgi:hypothetical protein
MFNPYTYTGADGSLSFSGADGFEAFNSYFGEDGAVGRVTGITLQVLTDVREFHEVGRRMPKELRAGNVSISGTVARAYINGAMIKLMLGKYADSEDGPDIKIPSFDMKIILDNLHPPGEPGNSILTVFGVIFDSWRFDLPEDDFVLERLSFKARRLAVNDTEATAP